MIFLLTLGLFVVLAAAVVALIVVLIVSVATRNHRLAYCGLAVAGAVIVLAIGLFVGFLYWTGRPYDAQSETELREAYRAEFADAVPAGVTVLKARQRVFADSGGQWLLLQATPEQLDKHIAMGFTKAGLRDFSERSGGRAPEWWKPPTEGLEIYECKDWLKTGGWAKSEAVMGVDRKANLIWFAASKMD